MGPPVIYESCSSRRLSSFSVSPASLHLEPPPRPNSIPRRRSPARPPSPLRHSPRAAVRHPRHQRQAAAAASCHHRKPIAARAPAPLHAVTTAATRRSAAYATHLHSPAQPSHPVLTGCSSFCLSRSSHCFRAAFVFPHTHATARRDGSREEEGEGGRGREARSQADSCRERDREGRDGGQGRRGVGIRPCSPVRDQRAASQGQGQRSRYGQSQRCQGH